ncbi:hypothetical protein SEA_SERENITY_64 [Mycobacterium phage Serenity]|uniref:hypothetical protein n=1 Tax=Mycobacterium phage Serenity TaxID=1701853 RepID=UPI0006CE300E|nr:hypothetical protein SEA_SERENITY_64 [Mycobacterium phage Serenity]ALF00931.1 hypothetical protein SEA_SERENITY_64 [Mycobacterium phage Serenity]
MISFKLLGYEIARIEFDFGETSEATDTVVEKVVDGMSGWWVERMLKRRRK